MRMNLDDTWKNCLSMWRWIAKEVRGGKPYRPNMKSIWCRKHGFLEVWSDCFFCNYQVSHKSRRDGDCPSCPGVKVCRDFDCMSADYSYDEYPIKFYNKLISLNRKRLKAKK